MRLFFKRAGQVDQHRVRPRDSASPRGGWMHASPARNATLAPSRLSAFKRIIDHGFLVFGGQNAWTHRRPPKSVAHAGAGFDSPSSSRISRASSVRRPPLPPRDVPSRLANLMLRLRRGLGRAGRKRLRTMPPMRIAMPLAT